MKDILQIDVEGLSSKYLGLPTYVGQARAKTFRICEGKNLEKDPRLEGEVVLKGRE